MIKRLLANQQFFYFLLAGGTAALTNFSSRMLYAFFVSYASSIILAYITGMFVAFTLCKLYIFESEKNNLLSQIAGFCCVNMVAIFITLGVSLSLFHYGLFFIHDVFIREELAHFIGICIPAISSFFGHKYLSFR